MALPADYSGVNSSGNFDHYTLDKLQVPTSSAGNKRQWGPFVVLNRSDLSGPNSLTDRTTAVTKITETPQQIGRQADADGPNDFFEDGGIFVVGKGWEPTYVDHKGVTKPVSLPSNFSWGFLLTMPSDAPVGADDNKIVLAYFEKGHYSGDPEDWNNPASSLQWAISDKPAKQSGDWNTDNDNDRIKTLNNAFSESDGKGLAASALGLNEFRVLDGGEGGLPAENTFGVVMAHRAEAFVVEQGRKSLPGGDAGDEIEDGTATITRYYANKDGHRNQYLKLRGSDGYYHEIEGNDGGTLTAQEPSTWNTNYTFNLSEKSVLGRGDDYPAFKGAANPVKYIYLEETTFDEDGTPYRAVSEAVPIEVVLGGGVVELTLRFWDNKPISGRAPYVNKRIRILSPTKANNSFWVC